MPVVETAIPVPGSSAASVAEISVLLSDGIVVRLRGSMGPGLAMAVSQAPAPSHPIRRGRAGPNLLAMVLAGKYAQHLPLHRQSAAPGPMWGMEFLPS